MKLAVSDAFMPDTGSSSSSSDGLRGERDRDFEQPLLAVGQRAAELRGAPLEADEVEDLPGLLAQPRSSAFTRGSASSVSHTDGGPWRCRPISTLSNTVFAAKTLVFWKVRTRPRFATSCDLRPVSDTPR